ncbi:hypothetical protein [Persicobacter diffluens]|uniref:Uncharacterized protein n=1 Tax=Persicobacter diffluens TaxID=981 RepID=A0AAN4W326_9BACT|nr:hypothetical protein PEDI_36320 [Persicobacter diffluens]
MTFRLRTYIVFVFLTFLSLNISAQQLDRIGKDQPIKVSGGLSFNQTAYQAWGIDSRRDPYRYILNGNLNFDIYGLAVPLSFSYSNQNFSYQQPFNQFALSPSYKWMNFQLGYGNMTFSPYTLAGHTFYGAGMQGSPSDRWEVAVMYGRLRKAVAPDSTQAGMEPSYRRMGYGAKAEYRHKGGNICFSFLKGRDEGSSLNNESLQGQPLPAEENLATNLYLGQRFGKLSIQVEGALSVLTHDLSSEKRKSQFIDHIFPSRTSTSAYWAMNSALAYQISAWNIGLGYERIGPEFRTHGMYYANNDLETATVNISGAMFGGKLNINTNIGGQRDNLDGQKVSDMSSLNGALSMNLAATKKLNISASYSNFRSFTVIRSQFEDINQADPIFQIDTLNFTQLTDAANASVNWVLGQSKTTSQALNFSVNYQATASEQSEQAQANADSEFWNGVVGWNWALRPADFRFGFSMNAAWMVPNDLTPSNLTLGPTVTLSKGFWDKKLKTRSSLSFNQAQQDGETLNQVWSWRVGASTNIKKSHSLNLTSTLINRSDFKNDKPSFSELTFTLGYSYRFSPGNKKSEKSLEN